MTLLARALAFLTIAAALFGTIPAARAATLKEELLRDWVEMKDTMMKITAAMPEDRFGFKSTPPQRNFGEQAMHVATSNLIGLGTLRARATAPAINRNATSKADILKALSDSFDYGTEVINEQTDQSLMETIEAVRYLGPSSRARQLWFLIGHAWDLYGQMAVYLRLNGVIPPASQRP